MFVIKSESLQRVFAGDSFSKVCLEYLKHMSVLIYSYDKIIEKVMIERNDEKITMVFSNDISRVLRHIEYIKG